MKKKREVLFPYGDEMRLHIRKMKLTAILLFIVCVTFGNSFSQVRLTVRFEKSDIRTVLQTIEEKTDYIFLYKDEIFDFSKKVTSDFKDAKFEEVLKSFCDQTSTAFEIRERQIILKAKETNLLPAEQQPQKKSLSGKVTDTSGGPLPGVSVIVKGTTIGTITDNQGNFILQVPSDSKTLQVSFVGMKTQEIAITGKTSINVILEEEIVGIEEVVAVGYGTMRKSDLTGSVVSINQESLANRPSTNIAQMLQGSMAGLTINVTGNSAEGRQNTMLIRGEKSITASNNPLIILDGVPFEGQLSEINPNDISSLEVLKDASSTAIYGARGANGVILITTKKGKAGEMITSYSGYYGIEKITNVPKFLDGKTFYEIKQARGLSTSAIEDQGYAEGRTTDWLSMATRTGTRQDHNLSISGGSVQTKYYISAEYTNVKGIAVGDNFDRYLFRINLDHKLKKWLTFGTSTQYGYYDRSGSEANFSQAFEMNPLGIPYNEDGSIAPYTWEDSGLNKNPISPTLYYNSDITRRFLTNNYFLIEFPFLKGLSYKINTGYDYSANLYQEYRGRNTNAGIQANGWLDIENKYDENWLIENILSYKADFGLNRLFLTALYSAQNEWNDTESVVAQGFPNDVMTYYQPDKATSVEPNSSYSENAHISQMFRANYSYNSRYLFTFTVRRDGYSAFGKDKKFGVFPSVAIGWNIANENFMKNMDKIDLLKLRVSYGVNGNEAISPYSTLPNLSSANYVNVDNSTLFGFYPNKIGDPTLGWETSKSTNFGLDFSFFNSRISGLIDMYSSKTTDLLLSKSISTVNGVSSILQNIGETKNKGIEFQVTTHNISKKEFNWKTNFNITHYQNEIVQVGLTDENGNYIDDIANRWFLGKPISVYYGYAFDGIWQEDKADTPQGPVTAGDIMVKDINGDEEITPSDRTILGQRIPDFIAGMTNTFTYKNWNLSFFLNGVYGIKKPNDLLSTDDSDLRRNRYPIEYWTPENKSNLFPRNAATEYVNSYSIDFIRDASFLRLQEVTLGYNFSSGFINKAGLNNLEVYTNFKNLLTFTKWEGLDPEFNSQTNNPQSITCIFGLRCSF